MILEKSLPTGLIFRSAPLKGRNQRRFRCCHPLALSNPPCLDSGPVPLGLCAGQAPQGLSVTAASRCVRPYVTLTPSCEQKNAAQVIGCHTYDNKKLCHSPLTCSRVLPFSLCSSVPLSFSVSLCLSLTQSFSGNGRATTDVLSCPVYVCMEAPSGKVEGELHPTDRN